LQQCARDDRVRRETKRGVYPFQFLVEEYLLLVISVVDLHDGHILLFIWLWRVRYDRIRTQGTGGELIQSSIPGFCRVVKRIPHDWRDPAEDLPSKATSLQDMTTLPGIIFALKVIHYS
jgi:hypothetical protein